MVQLDAVEQIGGVLFLMIKDFFCSDTRRVSIALLGNVSLSVVGKLTEFAHLLLTIGQIGVAVATVIYIWKKIRALKK